MYKDSKRIKEASAWSGRSAVWLLGTATAVVVLSGGGVDVEEVYLLERLTSYLWPIPIMVGVVAYANPKLPEKYWPLALTV